MIPVKYCIGSNNCQRQSL